MVGPMSLLLFLSACVWVSDDEVDAREAELTDADSDGFVSVDWGGDDCNDADATVNPGAGETPYDGVDNDCSDATPDEDLDGDGFDSDVDCNDDDATVNPGAAEICDGLDQDCDDIADNGVQLTVYADADADGYGDPDVTDEACTVEDGWSDNAEDCDDESADFSPEADEICDGLDNDCDELTDDDDDDVTDPLTWYRDGDNDGYGDLTTTTEACDQPEGYVDNAGDCSDSDDLVHPDGIEILGDFDDGDCDGDDDTFSWDLVDTRDSAYLRGPVLSYTDSGSTELIQLGWAAVEFDDGSGTLYDGMLLSSYDAGDPKGGEVDFLSQGETTTIGVTGEAADIFIREDVVVWARSFDASAGRVLKLDLYDFDAGGWSEMSWQQNGLTKLFDDLQIALGFYTDEISAIGCSTRGGGSEAVQMSLTDLQGQNYDNASHAFDATALYTHCDYDETLYKDFYQVTGTAGTLLRTYNIVGDSLVEQNAPWTNDPDEDPYYYTELEFTFAHEYWSRVIPLEYPDGTAYVQLYSYWVEGPSQPTAYEVTEVPYGLVEADIASGPGGEALVCAIDSAGDLSLLLGKPTTSSVIDDYKLPAPGTGAPEDCAVAITAEGVAAVSVREGDDLYLGFVQLD